MKLTLAAVAAIAAVVSSTAAAGLGAILLRATTTPAFLVGTASCPLFRIVAPVETTTGEPLGSLEYCVASASGGLGERVDASGDVTFRLPGGAIDATLHLVEIPIGGGFIRQLAGGELVEGRARTRAQAGRWSATGPIRVDPDGTPHPNVLFAIALR